MNRPAQMASIILATIPLSCAAARAMDVSVLIAEADAAYAQREDVPQAKIAMIGYERAAAMDASRAVECYWKASRLAWWLGQHAASRAEELQYFKSGMDSAERALGLSRDSVEAHFWLGGNMGSFGEAKGVLKSLAMVKPIRSEMAEVIRLNDRYLNGGAYRVLGAVDYKVPALFGGSKKRAKEELLKALSMGPNDAFTHYYLAEFYRITGEKAQSRAEIETLQHLQVKPEDQPELKMLQDKAARDLK